MMKTLLAVTDGSANLASSGRHSTALIRPDATERPIISLLEFLKNFRENHDDGSDVKLSMDSYSGPVWLDVLKAARALLSTELGRLDGGLLDGFILEELGKAGFSEEDL
jgi:hypothetical protein